MTPTQHDIQPKTANGFPADLYPSPGEDGKFLTAGEFQIALTESLVGNPDYADVLPPLAALTETHLENSENMSIPYPYQVDLTNIASGELPDVSVLFSHLSPRDPEGKEIEDTGRPTFLLMGGAISSNQALLTLGAILAARGERVIMVPHTLNQDIQPLNGSVDAFRKSYYQYTQDNGPMSPDAKYHAALVKHLTDQGIAKNGLHAVGFSAGGAAMLGLSSELSNSEYRLKQMTLVESGGAVPTNLPKAIRRLYSYWVAVAFIAEGIYRLNIPHEKLLEMEDAGNPGHSLLDMISLPSRLVASHLSAAYLNLPPTEFISGRKDLIFPVSLVEAAINEMKRQDLEKHPNIKMTVIEDDGHTWITQRGVFWLAEQLKKSNLSQEPSTVQE